MKLVDRRGHLALEDRWDLVHYHALGREGEAFLAGLDRGILTAARCPGCGRVLVPPRSFCERCFRATELVELNAREGELLTFTIVRHPFAGAPRVPFAVAYVRPDGADTALGALVDGVDLERADAGLAVGMRVALLIRGEGAGIDRLRVRPLA